MNNRKGVTLIEMVIVLALLGILANITYWYYTSSIKRAEKAVDEYNSRVALIEQMASEGLTSSPTSDYRVIIYTEPDFKGTAIEFFEGNTPTRGVKSFKSILIEGDITVLFKHDNSGKRKKAVTSSGNINIDNVNFIEVVRRFY